MGLRWAMMTTPTTMKTPVPMMMRMTTRAWMTTCKTPAMRRTPVTAPTAAPLTMTRRTQELTTAELLSWTAAKSLRIPAKNRHPSQTLATRAEPRSTLRAVAEQSSFGVRQWPLVVDVCFPLPAVGGGRGILGEQHPNLVLRDPATLAQPRFGFEGRAR